MSDGWDAYADGWDTDEMVRAYAEAAFASLGPVLSKAGISPTGARAVDFGAGTGLLTERLARAGAEVVAVDTSSAMLAVLEDKIAQAGWSSVATTTDLDEVAPEHDLVVCSSVCAFLDDYPQTVADLVGLLRPGGLFVQWDWERAPGPAGDDDHGLTRAEIETTLRRAGLEAIEVGEAFAVDVGDAVMRPLIGHGRRPAAS
jgi:trans-aconitate methyltransferase